MRNKRVRALQKEAMEIIPNRILNKGGEALNPVKNFIRSFRKSLGPITSINKKRFSEMMRSYKRNQRRLKAWRKK